ncbi:hypothetical protein V6N13_032534 [Hibiscus sabdariffa]|uniref:Uncharacterized protein n=1 Tax=Hibiscus sabdariffa TaxID=183260 RepID=A0ABR2AUW4_9ROSI
MLSHHEQDWGKNERWDCSPSVTTSKRWQIALRRESRGDNESAAEAVVLHGLERSTALRAWGGLGGTRNHKRCAHIQVGELSGAALCLRRLGLHCCYSQQQP